MSGVPNDLLVEAKAAWHNAYVPYSHFRVGAALRSEGGTIYRGCNVENASYGLTRCGEQSAVQAMVSAGETAFSEIVVYTEAETIASPCGACRQILCEFSPQATLYLANHLGQSKRYLVADLLPDTFHLNALDTES